jgi:hypothetical protein
MVTTGTKTVSNPLPELNAYHRFGDSQMLGIGIHRNEFDTRDLLPNHPGDRIAAGSTEANDLDFCRAGNETCLCHFTLLACCRNLSSYLLCPSFDYGFPVLELTNVYSRE